MGPSPPPLQKGGRGGFNSRHQPANPRKNPPRSPFPKGGDLPSHPERRHRGELLQPVRRVGRLAAGFARQESGIAALTLFRYHASGCMSYP